MQFSAAKGSSLVTQAKPSEVSPSPLCFAQGTSTDANTLTTVFAVSNTILRLWPRSLVSSVSIHETVVDHLGSLTVELTSAPLTTWIDLICLLFLTDIWDGRGKKAQVVRSNVHWGQTEGCPFLNITLGTCTFGSGTCPKLCFHFLPSAYFDGHDKKKQCEIYCCKHPWDSFKDTNCEIKQCPFYEGPWEKFVSGIRKSCVSAEHLWRVCRWTR